MQRSAWCGGGEGMARAMCVFSLPQKCIFFSWWMNLRQYKQFQRAESMQWDVAVNHTHQSRAEAQKRLSVQRKLAFLVFQGKDSFSAAQTLSVPAHLTWISIFSGALAKRCTGIRKIRSNIGFSSAFEIISDQILLWLVPGVVSPQLQAGAAPPEPSPRWAAGEGGAGKASEGDTERRGLGNTKRSTANQRCLQRKKRAVFKWNVPFARAPGSTAEGMLWNSRISLEGGLEATAMWGNPSEIPWRISSLWSCVIWCVSKDNHTDIIK